TGTISYSISPNVGIQVVPGTFSSLTAGSYTVTATDVNGCTSTITLSMVLPPSPVITVNSTTPILCNGGTSTITVSGSGGLAPYTYSFNGNPYSSNTTYTNNLAGVYNVTIKDANNCTGTGMFNIGTTNGPVAINTATQTVTCFGASNGAINATALGGTSPITFHLMPGNINNTSGLFSGLLSGTYSITATDANGCTQSTTVLVNTLPLIQLNVSNITPVSCFGGNNGSAVVSATGGNNVFSYNLMPGNLNNTNGTFFGLNANTYTVQVSDGNNCTKTSTLIINTPTPLQVSNQSVSPVLCFGGNTGSLQWQLQGGTGAISYTLQPGNLNNTTGNFSNLSAGIYTLQGTDANGCTKTSTLTVTQPPVLTISNVLTTVPSCN
ncbi:MAG: hypothetical protein FGM54_12035, partial [Chitinophagaceae bacterium]|nr:hypothetical protein [Chitinophagaceae bacterium]